MDVNSPFLSFFFAAVISLILAKPAMALARRFGVMDIPGSAAHKVHARPTPLAGGILAAMTISLAAFFFRAQLSAPVQGVLLGALIIFAFGMWDDLSGLGAFPKLVGQLLACGVILYFDVGVKFIGTLAFAVNFPLWLVDALNIAVTLFWVVGITNAVNMIDSMDGIVSGMGAIVSACFAVAAWLARQPLLSFWAAILLGLCVGLYVWNKIPAKFFLGDSGAQLIGFLLSCFGMMYNPRNFYPDSSWIVPILLLSLPIFDTTLVVVSRLQKGQSVKSGRRDHTYHRLVASGLSPARAVAVTHAVVLALSLLAFFTLYLPPVIALTLFVFILICGFFVLRRFLRMPTLDAPSHVSL